MAYNRPSMLRFLRVRNFALIDQVELHFSNGFNLLSGETGAGKSMIVDALGLLAGSKASPEMVRTGETRAVVEAIFEAEAGAELSRLGLDAEEDEIIIKREISADARNRVYINNQPLNDQILNARKGSEVVSLGAYSYGSPVPESSLQPLVVEALGKL